MDTSAPGATGNGAAADLAQRILLLEHEHDLIAQPLRADRGKDTQSDRLLQAAQRMRFDAKTQALFKTHGAEYPRRVVDKTGVMQDAHFFGADVGARAEKIDQLPVGILCQAHCQGIDGEIAPGKVIP